MTPHRARRHLLVCGACRREYSGWYREQAYCSKACSNAGRTGRPHDAHSMAMDVYSQLTDDDLRFLASEHREARRIRFLAVVCKNWPYPENPVVIGLVLEPLRAVMKELRGAA